MTLVAAWGAHPIEAAATAPATDSVETVTFEIQPDEITVRVATSRPVPRFRCEMAREGGGPILVFADAASRLERLYEPPVAFLGPLRIEGPAAGARGQVVVRFEPRSAILAGVEQREDAVALRFRAVHESSGEGGGEYRIGAGDKIEIAVFGHDDLVKIVEVGGDGSVNFPLVGDLRVEGKTVSEIDEDLTRRLGTEFLVDPQVSVEVREYRSQWITLMGEVRTPGRYALRRDMHLLDVIAEAGGPTKEAGQDIVVTRREADAAGNRQVVVTMEDLLGARAAGANVTLRHGDVIAVSERAVFYIRGEVNRPSAFILDRGMTILKAAAVAGGLTQFANRKEVQLLRSKQGGGQENITVNLKAIEDGKSEDIPLKADDVIIVPRRIF